MRHARLALTWPRFRQAFRTRQTQGYALFGAAVTLFGMITWTAVHQLLRKARSHQVTSALQDMTSATHARVIA